MTTPPTGPPDPSAPQPYPGNWGTPPPQNPGGYPQAGYPAAGGQAPATGGQPLVTGGQPFLPPGGYPPPGFPPPTQYPPAGGYPPPGAGPDAFPPGPPPAPTAKPNAKRTRIIGLALVAVVVIVGGALYLKNRNSATENAAVGDCIQVTSVSIDKADTAQIDCADPEALYVVTASGDGELRCESNEASYTRATKKDGPATNVVCLRPNVQVDECWDEGLTTFSKATKGDCATLPDSSTKAKVLLVDTTTSDESKCPAGTLLPVSYPTRNALICLGTP